MEAEATLRLVDSSVAVPLVNRRHPDHGVLHRAVGRGRLGLAGHAAFETHAVLSRLPAPFRLSPSAIPGLLRRAFPGSVQLSADRAAALMEELGERGIAGGAVFDALVGAAATEHGLALVTRDRRARSTYEAFGVDVQYIR